MKLDDDAKNAVRELGDAVHETIKKSAIVAEAIERLREIGYSPSLTLKLEIGLDEIREDTDETAEFDLTEDDVRALRLMKIKL